MVDVIVEPARNSLIPKFDEVKAAGLGAGALGGGISGSGPSIFMISSYSGNGSGGSPGDERGLFFDRY